MSTETKNDKENMRHSDEVKYDKGNNWFEDFIIKCLNNSIKTMDYYEEIKETREYSSVQELRDAIDNNFLTFCFNNGLWNRINSGNFNKLSDEQKTLYSFFNLKQYQPKNKYRQRILDYYYSHLDVPISKLTQEDCLKEHTKDYYSLTPPTFLDMDEIKVREPHINKLDGLPELVKAIPTFIKIGQCIQFDIEGFPKNQLYYLIVGICVCDLLDSKHSTFKELINHIKSYIQLFITSKCLELPAKNDNPYNLITFIDFKDALNYSSERPNFRYQAAKKYLPIKEGIITKTQFKDDEKGKYIYTEYSTEEYILKWKELEELYTVSGLSDNLICKWFDGQLLTRSTCLIGVILMIYKNIMKRNLIKFKKDEMPDWKAILQGNYDDTFEILKFEDNLSDIVRRIENITLGKILLIVREYINLILKIQ